METINAVLKGSAPLFDTQGGRDKLCRIIQYFLMFYIPVLKSRKGNKVAIEKCEIIQRNCGLTRNVLRFGMEIPIIIGIMHRFRQRGEKLAVVKTLADFCDIVYLLLDHPMYFVKTGFLKNWSPEL